MTDTPADLPHLAHQIASLIAEYHASLAARPVTPDTAPRAVYQALPDRAPEHPEAWDDILRDVNELILPNLTNWQSPDFFAYFPSNTTVPAMLADFLCAGLGVQGMLWSTSPAATELEMRTLDWLANIINLPKSFTFEPESGSEGGERGGGGGGGGGVINGTASEAVLSTMIAARHRAMTNGADPSRLTAYTSTQAHSSVAKAARVMGLPSDALRLIDTDDALTMRPDSLRSAIEQDRKSGALPFFCCATLGTTSTGAFDPISRVAPICAEHGVYLHIDAAWAGSALVCPEYQHLLAGVEHADAFNFNPHKWLLTNFDCSCLWVRDRKALIDAMSITPEYLRNPASESGRVVDYRDWHIPLGRRFRALKLWFVIRRYGVEGLRAHIRRHIALAEELESLIGADDRFERFEPRSLALVCFAHRDGDQATRTLLERVNASRRAFLTHTVVPFQGKQRYLIRVAIGSMNTQQHNIHALWKLIKESV